MNQIRILQLRILIDHPLGGTRKAAAGRPLGSLPAAPAARRAA